jgi:hypothetical protein
MRIAIKDGTVFSDKVGRNKPSKKTAKTTRNKLAGRFYFVNLSADKSNTNDANH